MKGLKPKLHDLALSMGENKTLNLKDKIFTRYHAIDIHIKFSVRSNSSLTICPQTGSGMTKLPLFSRNLQKYVSFY
jgi:hypothetical protein